MTNSEFKKLLNEPIKLSEEEIKEILETELQKSESETDADLIEYCLDELNRMKNAPKKKKGRLIKILAPVAAAVVIIALSAPLLNNYLADDYLMRGTELTEELIENGFEEVQLPEELLSKKCKVEKIVYEKGTENSSFSSTSDKMSVPSAKIYFEYKGEENTATIKKYRYAFYDCVGNASASQKIEVSGGTVYVLEKDGKYAVAYKKDNVYYAVALPFDYEETVEFAKTIKLK